jgi:hypothetical protein
MKNLSIYHKINHISSWALFLFANDKALTLGVRNLPFLFFLKKNSVAAGVVPSGALAI